MSGFKRDFLDVDGDCLCDVRAYAMHVNPREEHDKMMVVLMDIVATFGFLS